MESIKKHENSAKQDFPEELPYLFNYIESNAVTGFDEENGFENHRHQQTATDFHDNPVSTSTQSSKAAMQPIDPIRSHYISVSVPASPGALSVEQTKKVLFRDDVERNLDKRLTDLNARSSPANIPKPEKTKYYSHSMPSGASYVQTNTQGKSVYRTQEQQNFSNHRHDDSNYESFKTWSGKLERQISQLVTRKPQTPRPESGPSRTTQIEALPVDRFFDALEGPELDTLRASEELVLPQDKQWPFLMRFPVSSFGICLGVSSQAILWKTLSTCQCTRFLHIHPDVNLILWCISVALTVIIACIYSLKMTFFFEAVRREYYHPIRVNFFFAPWIALLFLSLGLPPRIAKTLPAFTWYVLMTPILCLELKIYGQWMFGGQRRLSKVANPSNHLSIIGNFVGSLLGASMGLKEGPIFFFAVGVAHYVVLFVTLYQRLPTNETLPKELHPVFFLFVAAPSVASMAWARLQGSFDYGARIAYFIALFLYFSLAIRVNFFRGFRFSLAWWAYTFPMTGAAIATIKYAAEVRNPVTQALSTLLTAISTFTVTALLVTTVVHAFVLRDLFPNDIAIAISDRRPKGKKHSHHRSASADAKDIEASRERSIHSF
ncbi:S-type anion channel SLAH2-like [Aristolochia californica]|uniref:S-type anion channel SLAH2-like n=1 Tax=Aristolochia californica TaxID=171875 RepID=UPI0035D99411